MKRFCPGCTQRKLQMNPAPCEICGCENRVAAPKPREKLHPLARMLRALLQPLGWFAHALTAIFCGFAVWNMAFHGIVEAFGTADLGLIFSGIVVVAMWSVRLLTRASVWVFAPATRQNRRPGARTFLVMPVCLAILWGLNRFDVPLRMAFLLSQPGLRQMPLVRTPNPPRWRKSMMIVSPVQRAGLYKVTRADANGLNARVKVTDNNFFWAGTSAGFAYCPQGGAAVRFMPSYKKGDPIRYIQLSRDWFWWEESGSGVY